MSLNVIKGVQKKPYRMLVYGTPGVGKSTFASQAPKPIFIDIEKRIDHIDAAKVPVATLEEVVAALKELVALGSSEYKTVVIDTVDALEGMVHTYLCKKHNCGSIEDVDGGYGKGYTKALETFRAIFVTLETLRDKGFNIVLVGHGHVRTFNNPTGENYDRWVVKINQKAADLIKQQVDAVGFAHYDDGVKKGKTALDKAKAVTSGDAVIAFSHHPAYESKRGLGLPDEAPLKFSELKSLQ